ncbi:MAG TPA: BlaI/MecI/CopY family transcriptional regulator [Puia sp.]|jgi:predicted transcriptional regulator
MHHSKKSSSPLLPTKTELDILEVLWKHGPSTVRFVHDMLTGQRGTVQYTSTLKLMQVMTEKGMLKRDETNMKHIYFPVVEEEKTKGFFLKSFIDSMYNGSLSRMLVALVDSGTGSKKELQKLKDLVSQMDKDK